MEKNIDNSDLTVDELVSKIGIGRSVFSRSEDLTGLAPIEFIREWGEAGGTADRVRRVYDFPGDIHGWMHDRDTSQEYSNKGSGSPLGIP
jgi:hypothetical protein